MICLGILTNLSPMKNEGIPEVGDGSLITRIRILCVGSAPILLNYQILSITY